MPQLVLSLLATLRVFFRCRRDTAIEVLALRQQGAVLKRKRPRPELNSCTKITLDAYAASHRAVANLKASGELPKRVQVRSSKYLNNVIEQDHRRVKQRLRPMLGLKSFTTAAVVIAGIELAERIRKGQFKTGKLGGRMARMPEIWQAALAA